jgi:hypothetical protein
MDLRKTDPEVLPDNWRRVQGKEITMFEVDSWNKWSRWASK